jgi:tetratricopeptide (TPR) repeat protein
MSDKLVGKALTFIVDGFGDDRNRIENLLIEATRISPRSSEAYATMARYILWQIGNGMRDPTEIFVASQLALQVKDLEPHRPLGDYLVSEVQLALGQSQQAQNTYAATKRNFPEHQDTYAFEARFLCESDPQKALDSAQKALAGGHSMDDLSPSIVQALTVLNKSKVGLGDAISRFASVYPDRWILHRAAKAYIDENQFDKAQNGFRSAIRSGNTLESRLQLGILEYTRMNNASAGIKTLEDLRREISVHEAVKSEAFMIVTAHLALAHLSAGNAQMAALEAGKAMRAGVSQVAIIVGLFEEFQKQKLGHTLEPTLKIVAQENPFLEYVHINLGNLATSRKEYVVAIEHFTHAIALSPERDDLYSARAHAKYSDLAYGDALKDFEFAIRYRPDQASHHYNKACMLSLLGRKQEAIVSLREALLMNRGLKDLARTDADLAELRHDNSLESQLISLGVVGEASDESTLNTGVSPNTSH